MRKSIFEIENRLDINKEFRSIVDALSEENTIYYNYRSMSFFMFLNRCVFNLWEYRDTFTELRDYLEFIGINESTLNGYWRVNEEAFLNFLELMINLMQIIKDEIGIDKVEFQNLKVANILPHNIPLILEKMNYEIYDDRDKKCIRKRDADVDSVLNLVPEDISLLLLSYNDIRNNNIDSKKTILKKIDLYIDSNKQKYKSIGKELLDSIDTIVNKMGINHKPDESPYNKLTETELCVWYDKCFKMMIHLIRTEEIIEIKKERNNLVKETEN